MASISFISNTGETHKEFLLDLFEQSDEIIFAVGFLKNSGFLNIKDYVKEFCLDKSKSSKFFIGTGLGETDPAALLSLNNVFKSKPNHQLILCTPDAGIFHPKIYVFRTGKKVTIITGSSNLTQHGWVVNDEVSMVSETTVDSPVFEQLNTYLEQLYKKYYSEDVSNIIERYKKEKAEHLERFGRGPAFRFRRKRTTIAGIDMPQLRGYYEIYKNADAFIEPISREVQYSKARENLDVLASTKQLNEIQFHSLFGPLVGHKEFHPKLWHSGSIHRKTHETLNYPDAFREIVREVKRNLSIPVSEAYNNAISFLNRLRKAKKIYGIGENIVTEIFLSYDAAKFANLNDNPLTVLELIGKQFPSVSGFKGEDYAEYVALLSRIKEDLGMNTLLEIDSFFNYVYWNMNEE